jgi:fatty-acyl-CoA synthase
VTPHATTGPSYPWVIAESLARYGGREAFIDGDRRLTYAQSAALVSQFQQALHEVGIGPGGTVVALSPNAPEVFLAQVATWMNGARYSGLHPLGSVDDHIALCDDAGASVLLAHPDHAETAIAVADGCPAIRTVLFLADSDAGENLLTRASAFTPRRLRPPQAAASEVVWMIYTGGTTGRSKAVLHGHRSMVQAMLAISSAWALPATPRYLACGPITHASVLPIVPTLARGGTVVLNHGFDPERWLDTITRERVNYAFVVPTMLYTLLDRTDPRRYDLSSLRSIIYGSAPMSPARLTETLDALGPILTQGYGQSETLGLATTLRADEHNLADRPELLSSCGRPVPGAQLAILDDEGSEVADGDVGELCVRAGFVMDGYWNQPELTEDALRGGWLHTGDLATRDDDGFLYIVDRKKDMIISGAFNIYPRDVEDILTADPDVSAAAVIGVPDPKWGEAVTAFVVARPGGHLDVERLRSAVRARKGAHHVPKQVREVTALPVTSLGKIDKKALRAPFWQGRGRAVN